MGFFGPILSDISLLAKPALFNIYFAFASIPIGFVLAIFLALGKASRNRVISGLSRGSIYAFRGSPFFIQLFMFYSLALALNIPLWKPMGIDWFVLHPLFLGPLILALNTTAYTAEILYGALLVVPKGEIESARAYGMSSGQMFRRVTWPHLIRIAWPAYTNEVVFLFHATALVYFTLPVDDRQAVSAQTDHDMASLWSAAGLCLPECLRLPGQDIDFALKLRANLLVTRPRLYYNSAWPSAPV